MKNVFHKIVSGILLITTLTACGPRSETPTAVPVDPGADPVVVLPTAQPSDPCINEYFPVKNNATWTYASTGSPSGPMRFTNTVTNVRVDGFTLAYQFGELTYNQEWACKPEGLVAMQLGPNNATSILAFQKFTNLQASNISGTIIPPSIVPGMEWTHALDIQGVENTTTGPAATMTARLAATYTAGNKETVTVPAGTFEAIAIEVSTVIDFTVVTQSNTVNLSVDSTYTIWYAPGVGLIKSSGYGKLGGQDYFETIELESYSIP